jgi:hypothetical protein
MTGLFATEVDKVFAALQEIPEKGNASFVLPLLKTYKAWETDEGIRAKIGTILYELKTPEAIPELMKALELPELQKEKAFILSIFWNAGLIPTELDILVRQALKGDFMVAFEVFTIAEQMVDTVDAEMARDAVFDIEDYLDEHPDADHVEVLQQLRILLIDYSNI